MHPKVIEQLGSGARVGLPQPYKRPPKPFRGTVLGFDAEYSSSPAKAPKGGKPALSNELVSFQFFGEGVAKFAPYTEFKCGPRGVNVAEFAEYVWELLGRPLGKIVLWSFFSHAEYSVLDVHSLDERLTFTPTGGDSYRMEFKDCRGFEVQVLDLKAFFPVGSLADIAVSFGMEKGAQDRTKISRRLVNDKHFQAYAMLDAQLCYRIGAALRTMLLEDLGVDSLNTRTPASAAAQAWRLHFRQEQPPMVRRYIREMGMLCYWGGTNEAFYRGRYKSEIRIYDAVSMYPNSLIQLGCLPNGEDWRRATEGNFDTARGGLLCVLFSFPEGEMYPCLPVLQGEGDGSSLVYPLQGVSYCTLHEARYAREIGGHVELLDGYVYDSGDDSAVRYMVEMLARKQAAEDAGDKPRRELYKLMANGLIGKFAQKRIEVPLTNQRKICQILGLPDVKSLWDLKPWDVTLLPAAADYGLPVELLAEKTICGSAWAPEWAALVNGYARAVERRVMRDLHALAGSTDSVIVPGGSTMAERFIVQGITYKLEAVAVAGTIVKNRTYAFNLREDYWKRDPFTGEVLSKVKAAMHAAPRTAETREHVEKAILEWRGKETVTFTVNRLRKTADGIRRGGGVGMAYTYTQTLNFKHDWKRKDGVGWTTPHTEILTEEQIGHLLSLG